MTRSTGSVLLLLLLVCVCVSSADDQGAMVVRFKPGRVSAPRGSSVKLSCKADYDFDLCDRPHVTWHLEQTTELTDPMKYLTTVNETLADGGRRLRQVVTEILHLTTEDSGRYHCIAKCGDAQSAVGRAYEVDVRG
ncbi:uncharacterized protein LOC141801457 [Halichoeres trimaculatus]|uniref:uncharacterized protein LOC141801457 n=1 Tax=Halichoeres trimaculatus TaxID=147232 RepID=UPI003D9EC8CB